MKKPSDIDLKKAITERHSVRNYLDKDIPADVAALLREEIDALNEQMNLHIQLVENEPKAFRGGMAYGKFSGVRNYFVMAGEKLPDLDNRVGYAGEKLVLLAQTLGLNTCWVGLTYSKVPKAYHLAPGEKIACVIAVGYGATQGVQHKSKSPEKVSNITPESPQWFRDGVDAALLAPTAVNQQKFHFDLLPGVSSPTGKPLVKGSKGFSLVGYTRMDYGIARLHFELGAGKENFDWAE